MKRHVQEPGIRKWSGTDLVELQSEPLNALEGFFGNFGPMILSGCEITGKTIAAGLVVLPEYENGKIATYRIATFAGTTVKEFPVCLELHKEELKRMYENTEIKPIAYEYTAVAGTGSQGLILNETGNLTFKEALQDATHRFVTEKERDYWNEKVSRIRSPFILFDGIETGGRLIKGKAPFFGSSMQTVYLTADKTFARKVYLNPGRYYLPTYYSDWEGREEFTEFYPENQTGTTTPYVEKLYLCHGVLYFWNGSELEKIGINEKENYSTLINKPRINGVTLEGDLSLDALGLREKTCPFKEILDEDITPLAASISSSNGDIVFLSRRNTFAFRTNPASGGGIIGQPLYYNNWMGAEDYVEFYTPSDGDGDVHTRPPLGRIYSIGQVKYYWDGNGLKVYACDGNGPGGRSTFTEFGGIVENVRIEMQSSVYSGTAMFARNSHYSQNTVNPENLNLFVINIGGKYYPNFARREKYSDENLIPYPEKLYKCGNKLYIWDGTTLRDTCTTDTLSMCFGNLLSQPHSTEAQVKAVTGTSFEILCEAVKKNSSLLDISRSEEEAAQVTGQCKTSGGKSQVVISFPFEFYQAATLSTLTIYEDYTADARHVTIPS